MWEFTVSTISEILLCITLQLWNPSTLRAANSKGKLSNACFFTGCRLNGKYCGLIDISKSSLIKTVIRRERDSAL